MANVKKRWSGNKRLIADLLWSSAITIFLNAINEIMGYQTLSPENELEYLARFLGSVIGTFFLFFFWSWNPHHIKCRIAKFAVHVGFGILALSTILASGVLSQIGWGPSLFMLAVNGLVAWKYFKLMWAEKESKHDIELEDSK